MNTPNAPISVLFHNQSSQAVWVVVEGFTLTIDTMPPQTSASGAVGQMPSENTAGTGFVVTKGQTQTISLPAINFSTQASVPSAEISSIIKGPTKSLAVVSNTPMIAVMTAALDAKMQLSIAPTGSDVQIASDPLAIVAVAKDVPAAPLPGEFSDATRLLNGLNIGIATLTSVVNQTGGAMPAAGTQAQYPAFEQAIMAIITKYLGNKN